MINYKNEASNRARRGEDKAIIVASIAPGVNRDGELWCVTPRAELIFSTLTISALRRCDRRSILNSIVNAVAAATNEQLTQYDSHNDSDLMNDLALLMAMRLTHGEAALIGSNIHQIMLAIDPDVTLPWERRGMLSAEDEVALGLSTRPIVLNAGHPFR